MIQKLKGSCSTVKRALGAARRQFLYPEYIRSNVGCMVDESSCFPVTYQDVKLTREEIEQVKSLWGRIIPGPLRRADIFYRMVKGIGEFSPRYLPSSFYYPYILFALSPEKYAQFLDNKSLLLMLFPEIAHPEQICCTIGGGYYDSSMRPITKLELSKKISKCDNDLIIKTSIESERGLGVQLVKSKDLQSLTQSIIDDSIFLKHDEFVIQKVSSQSVDTAVFNPTSLNCMRITTLNLNGNVSVCSQGLKCGGNGAYVDNIGGGRGGVIVGIKDDGSLCSTGFYANGESTKTHNGVAFEGKKISNFTNVIEAATNLAQRFRNVKIIGWDIALAEDGSPVLIEANAIWPGITLEQFTTGPIFGERTEEVIDFVSKNRK